MLIAFALPACAQTSKESPYDAERFTKAFQQPPDVVATCMARSVVMASDAFTASVRPLGANGGREIIVRIQGEPRTVAIAEVQAKPPGSRASLYVMREFSGSRNVLRAALSSGCTPESRIRLPATP